MPTPKQTQTRAANEAANHSPTDNDDTPTTPTTTEEGDNNEKTTQHPPPPLRATACRVDWGVLMAATDEGERQRRGTGDGRGGGYRGPTRYAPPPPHVTLTTPDGTTRDTAPDPSSTSNCS
jgi:hypothetical protein